MFFLLSLEARRGFGLYRIDNCGFTLLRSSRQHSGSRRAVTRAKFHLDRHFAERQMIAENLEQIALVVGSKKCGSLVKITIVGGANRDLRGVEDLRQPAQFGRRRVAFDRHAQDAVEFAGGDAQLACLTSCWARLSSL